MHTGAQRNDAKQQGIEWYEGERSIQSFYDSDITSYDYQAPISEAGDYGQPGSGGPNKFEVDSTLGHLCDALLLQNTLPRSVAMDKLRYRLGGACRGHVVLCQASAMPSLR